jgi:NAD(P)-dependent dehydrogenase (short-subunit alcohol dehydrogenase family)
MSEHNLRNKVAIVTGASKGLGKAIALALGSAGASVALVSRDGDRLKSVMEEVNNAGGNARVFVADVSDEKQVRQLERDVLEAFQAVHILVNNVGMNLRKDLVDFTLEEWRTVLDTNLTSVFLMCRSMVPHIERPGLRAYY